MSTAHGSFPEIQMVPGWLRMPEGLGENQPGQPLPIASFLTDLFQRLDASPVTWAVLRNAEGLPAFTRYDVDLLTEPGQLDALLDAIDLCAEESGWQIAGRIRKRHYTCLLLLQGTVESGLFFLPLDLFTALEYRGMRYLDTTEVLSSRIQTANGVWTVPSGMDAAITLLKEWMPHGVLKENSRATVQAQAAADPDGFLQTLTLAVGPEQAAHVVQRVRQGRWQLSGSEAKALRRNVRRRTPGAGRAFLRAVGSAAAHLFRPSLGTVVCLAGADGSGKTTLAQGIAAAMFKRPFKACRYIHGNVGVLPRFRDVRAFFRGTNPPAQESPVEGLPLKGMMTPIPAWKSILLATYYALDLNLARFRLRRWRGQWSLVIMDRSFYDYFVQLGHRNCPKGYLRFLSILIPKPDVLLCLVGNPEKIHARKPELTVEEIQREQVILHELAQRLPFGRLLDGDGGVCGMVETGCREVQRLLLAAPARSGPSPRKFRCWHIGTRPVMAYAAGTAEERLCAVDLFPRTTFKRNLLARAIRLAVFLRGDGGFSSLQDSIDPLLPADELERLLTRLKTVTGAPAPVWLVTWPAQPERKRLYLISKAPAADHICVVKIGAGEFNGRQLRNEAAALKHLSAAPHSFSVPSVLFEEEFQDGRTALALDGFPVPSRPLKPHQAAILGAKVIEELRQVPVSTPFMRWGDCDWVASFRGKAPSCPATQRLLESGDEQVDVGFAHGDLGPGNMREVGGGTLLLFDWENASQQAPLWTDAVGLWMACRQQKILRDPAGMAVALRGEWGLVKESSLLFALAFLCAHGNVAAFRLLEGWE